MYCPNCYQETLPCEDGGKMYCLKCGNVYDDPIENADHIYGAQLIIKEWMQSAKQETPEAPTLGTQKIRELRYRLIEEELLELGIAYTQKSLAGIADAVADLLYVVYGTAVAHGIDILPVFLLVHNNNVEKIAKGRQDSGGKWIKPEDHQPPDIEGEIARQLRQHAIRADSEAVSCPTCQVNNKNHRQDEGFPNFVILCDGSRVKL